MNNLEPKPIQDAKRAKSKLVEPVCWKLGKVKEKETLKNLSRGLKIPRGTKLVLKYLKELLLRLKKTNTTLDVNCSLLKPHSYHPPKFPSLPKNLDFVQLTCITQKKKLLVL